MLDAGKNADAITGGAITSGNFGVMPYGSFTHTEQVEASGLVKFISGITGESVKITTGKLLYKIGDDGKTAITEDPNTLLLAQTVHDLGQEYGGDAVTNAFKNSLEKLEHLQEGAIYCKRR
ncbi:hypothetical protein MIDIC_170008 [Alphaproteobacteria bacterium]